MTAEIIGKACTGCGSFKLFSEYTKHKNGKYGFRSACKVCTNAGNAEWRRSNPEASKAATNAWREAHPERTKSYGREYRQRPEIHAARMKAQSLRYARRSAQRAAEREATREEREKRQAERRSAYSAAYKKANRERLRLKDRALYLKNRVHRALKRSANNDRSREYNKAYRVANPDRHRVYDQNKRMARARAQGKLSPGIVQKLFRLQRGLCPCCSKPLGDDYHLDHKMPIALGGWNTDDNMQLLRAVCNMQKHAKHPVDFMQSRGFLL